MRETGNIIVDKTRSYALKIVSVYKKLCQKNEFVMSKQLLRSGTSIGANATEASRAQSHADFTSKMSIALKEASETEFWLELLHDSGYLDDEEFNFVFSDCQEIIRILISIVKKANQNK